MVVSHLQSYWDKVVVIVYVIFVATLIFVRPAATVSTSSFEYYFSNCSGDWDHADAAKNLPDILADDYSDLNKVVASSTQWKSGVTALECSGLVSATSSKNIVSGLIHVVGFTSDQDTAVTSTIQIAGIDDVSENVPTEIATSTTSFADTVVEVNIVTSTVATSSTELVVENDIFEITEPVVATSTDIDIHTNESTVQIPVNPGLIEVQYFAEGIDWRSAGIIENFSQKTFDFPINFEGITDQNIDSLRVRLVGISETNVRIFYVDSVWVSLESMIDESEAILTEPVIEKSTLMVEKTEFDVVQKGEAPPFDGVVIENPAIIIPEPEKVIVDPSAHHACEFADYRVHLNRAASARSSVDILVSGVGGASSTLHAVRIPEGLSFVFDNGADEIALLENQVSAKISVGIVQEIEARSFNVPIVYSMIRPDLVKSNSICHLNVIVE